jgi:hypothetical protein
VDCQHKGNRGAVSSNDNTGTAALSVNAYESSDGGWSRVAGTNAARFQTNYLGEHKWSNAIGAAGGTAISWVDQMTLSAAGALTVTGAATFGGNATVNGGNLVIGTGGGGNGLGALISKGAAANFYEAYDGTKTMIAGTDAGNDFVKIGSLSAHPVGFVVGNVDKMRIDASGNLLAGTSVTKGSRVHSSGAAASASPTLGSATDTSLLLSNSDVTYGINFGVINNGNGWIQQHSNTGTAAAYDLLLQPVGGNLLVGASSSPQISAGSVARIQVIAESSGATAFAPSLPASATGTSIRSQSVTAAGTGWNHFVGSSGNGSSLTANNIFIYGNGDIGNTNNSYGAISDAKLKENITDATPKLAGINAVRIVNYNLIDHPEVKQLGVIAQELEQIFPGMVSEAPDRDMEGNDLGTVTKSVKYSVFVPMLIKAMQEQQATIEALTARIEALEGAK